MKTEAKRTLPRKEAKAIEESRVELVSFPVRVSDRKKNKTKEKRKRKRERQRKLKTRVRVEGVIVFSFCVQINYRNYFSLLIMGYILRPTWPNYDLGEFTERETFHTSLVLPTSIRD